MKHLLLSLNHGVLTISLNRPEKRNAFFPEMIAEISKAFADGAKDRDVRAILLTAQGQSFCSGGDLEWMKSMASYTLAKNLKDADQLFEMYWRIYSCPVPVVGRVFGHCFGGGAGLTAVCDIVAAETTTQFSFSEVKWGLVPAVISPFVIERAHPAQVAEWFATAKVFTSPEALSGGLINFCGTVNEVDHYLEQTFKLVSNSAPGAVLETKKLLRSYSQLDWKKTRAKVTKLIAQRRVSEEGQRGLKAFLEKKNPQWSDPPYGVHTKI